MAAKTIALDAEAYRILARAKKPGETFSEVVKRTLRPRRPLTDFAGAWKELEKSQLRSIRKEIAAGRRSDLKRRQRLDATLPQ